VIEDGDNVGVPVTREKSDFVFEAALLIAGCAFRGGDLTATGEPSAPAPPKTRPAPPSPINSSRTYELNAVSSVTRWLSLVMTCFSKSGTRPAGGLPAEAAAIGGCIGFSALSRNPVQVADGSRTGREPGPPAGDPEEPVHDDVPRQPGPRLTILVLKHCHAPFVWNGSQMGTIREDDRSGACAYCDCAASTTDHVVARALYPPSTAASSVPRITVPACAACNGGWSDDEAHFRNVMLLSGAPTPAVRELWEGKVRRSFTYRDGKKRARDLAELIVPVTTREGARHMIFPGKDERVLRVVRKTVRGLCHHHGLLSPVRDGQVLAVINEFEIMPEFLAKMTQGGSQADVLDYRLGLVEEEEIHSGWLLTYYGRTPFLCIVFRSIEMRSRLEAQAVLAQA